MNVGDTIEIDTGSGKETRKIASLGTAAGSSTTLWQPLPDGPVITIPAGSTTVPYTGGGGVAVSAAAVAASRSRSARSSAIGYGATYPAVANTVEKYEVVTVTEVGKPGTQTRLAAAAKAGDTTIRVMNAANISAGDKIILDIDSKDHGIETVTVKSVAAPAALAAAAALAAGAAAARPSNWRPRSSSTIRPTCPSASGERASASNRQRPLPT